MHNPAASSNHPVLSLPLNAVSVNYGAKGSLQLRFFLDRRECAGQAPDIGWFPVVNSASPAGAISTRGETSAEDAKRTYRSRRT